MSLFHSDENIIKPNHALNFFVPKYSTTKEIQGPTISEFVTIRSAFKKSLETHASMSKKISK